MTGPLVGLILISFDRSSNYRDELLQYSPDHFNLIHIPRA